MTTKHAYRASDVEELFAVEQKIQVSHSKAVPSNGVVNISIECRKTMMFE